MEQSQRDANRIAQGLPILNASSLTGVWCKVANFSQVRESFCQGLAEHKLMIVVADTGSGKTTQLPQYAAEVAFAICHR